MPAWTTTLPRRPRTPSPRYGLGILVPLATLWLGTSAIGDLVEDKLLVYLSLKPVPRWQLPAAAILATVSVVVPLTALPLTVVRPRRGAGDVAWATFLAASLAALAYAGLFVAAGFWFRRAVWWGLAFVLIWENVAPTPQKAPRASRCSAGRPPFSVWRPAIDVQLEAGSAGRRVRRAPGDRDRSLAGRDLALPPRRHRLGAGERAADDDLARRRACSPAALLTLAHADVRPRRSS